MITWKKIPSVTEGGAPFFFNTVTDDYYARRSVVWDRVDKAWSVKGPQTLEHYSGKLYGLFRTAQAAKRFVERGGANY